MRTFFSTALITLALLVGAAGAAPAAHAEDIPIPDDAGAVLNLSGTALDPTGALTTAADAADAAKVKTDPNLKGAEEGFDTIMIWIMSLFAWLVGVAALLLDYTVYFTVVKMGSYVNDLSAIGVTWRVLRDIGNIMLIFGFLAAGIATILNTEFYGWKTKMLPRLLVAAVFINFSLFISEAIVDTGNLFATQFYTQINGGNPAGLKDFDRGSITLSNEGISNKLMAQLGLQSIYGEVSNSDKAAEILKAGNSWVIGFMGVILFMVTAFVMFSLAFVLIARFVALIFLLVVAPIGFAGLAIPGLAARAKQWWTTLLEQTITAPILLLMLYIALAVITDAQFLTGFCLPGESTITGAVNTNTTCTVNAIGWVSGNFQGFASFILSFLVAIGLLLAVIVYAKRWSAFGADMATKFASRASGATLVAAGLAKGTRYVGRNTLGRAGNTRIGKALGMGGLANATFDFRNSKLAKTAQTRTGLDLGTGGKGGYKTYATEATKKRRDKETTTELNQAEQLKNQRQQYLNQVQATYDTATKEHAKRQAEVERLTKEQAGNALPDPVTEQKLDIARAEAVASKKALDDANANLARSSAAVKEANERADRARERIEKMKDRDAIAELRESLRETAEKTKKEVAEAKIEKKESKPDEKK